MPNAFPAAPPANDPASQRPAAGLGGHPATLIVIALALALWILLPKVYVFSDPVLYLSLAHDLPNLRDWAFDTPFQHRLGLLALHGGTYGVFGTSEWSTFLPQFALLAILILTALSRLETTAGKLYAAAVLCLLLPQTVTVFPDLGAAAFMFLAVLTLERRTGALAGAAFAAAAFCAFQFKLTAIFVAVPFGILMLADAVAQRRGRAGYYATAIATAVGLFGLYAAAMWALTGDPLARLTSVETVAGQHLWNLHGPGALFQRLVTDPPPFFFGFFGAAILIALAGGLRALMTGGRHTAMALYFFTGLLLFVFGSVSLSGYQPMPLMDRMIAYLVPPAAVLSASLVGSLAQGPAPARRLIAALLLGLAAVQAAAPLTPRLYGDGLAHLHEGRKFVAGRMTENPGTVTVLAEPRTRDRIGIYFGFAPPDPTRFALCPSPDRFASLPDPVVFIDRGRAAFLAEAYGTRVCPDAMADLARSAGLTVIADTPGFFIAARP